MRIVERFSATEKVIFGVFVIAAAVTAFLMAVRTSNYFTVAVPGYGGEIREGLVGLPRNINPVLALTDADKDLAALIYSGLMKYDEKNELAKDLAEDFAISADGLTYTFRLRPDAHFQDGKPVTTDDVEFTVQKIQDAALKSPRRADWINVSIEKVSATEIRFILKQPYSPFLANTTIGILPKHIWSTVTDEQFVFSEHNTKPVGSGPYRISSIVRDSSGIPTEYKLSTWKDYYGNEPYLTNIHFDIFNDYEKALAAMDHGTIDSLAAVPASEMQKVIDISSTFMNNRVLLTAPLPRIFNVFINQSQAKVLADKVVRQALDMSINRDYLIKEVLSGFGSPLAGPLPSGMIEYKPPANGTSSAIEQAIKLLETNGWKKDASGVFSKKVGKTASSTLAFTIYTADADDLKRTADVLKANWTSLGASVDIKTFSASDLYQNVIRPRKYDVLLFGEQVGKDRDLYAFWHSSQINAPGLNISMYANGKVDKLLEEIRTTTDEKKRLADYDELDRIIRADVPVISLYSPDFIYIVPKKLKGIAMESIAAPSDRFNSIARWYVNTQSIWKFFTNN